MILACDIGTSSLKAGIIDSSGRLVCSARISIESFAPGFKPEKWTAAFFRAVRTFPENTLKKLRAIGVSGQGPTLVPLFPGEGAGKPLFWFEHAGNRSSKSLFLPLVDRFRHEYPQDYQKTLGFLPCPEYLCFRLTGEKAVAIPHDGFIPYYWDDEEIDAAGLRGKEFPKFRVHTQALGRVSESAARKAGIPAGLLVFCTGPDFIAAMLGTASHLPGRVNVRGGTSETINAVLSAGNAGAGPAVADSFSAGLPVDLPKAFRIVPGVLPDTLNISAFHSNSGRMHALISETLFSGRNSYDRFCAAAKTATGGVTFNPPGEANVTMRAGALAECFSGEKGKLTRENKARAFLEYAAERIAGSCRLFAAAGISVRELRVCGGLSKCRAYNLIRAKRTGLPVVVPKIRDAELLGNAGVAMAGLGDFANPGEAAGALFQPEETIAP